MTAPASSLLSASRIRVDWPWLRYKNDGLGEREVWLGVPTIPLPRFYETDVASMLAWYRVGYPKSWGFSFQVMGCGAMINYDSTMWPRRKPKLHVTRSLIEFRTIWSAFQPRPLRAHS